MTMPWEIQECSWVRYMHVERYATPEWEPFSVTKGPNGYDSRVWLRRRQPEDILDRPIDDITEIA